MKKKTINALELTYRFAYGLGVSALVAAMVIGLSVSASGSASAADNPQAQKEVWCHCGGYSECRTIELSQSDLENAGHVDEMGNILHLGDHPGACADPTDETTEEPTAQPTGQPTDPPPPGETPTVSVPSVEGGDDSSAVVIPVTGFSMSESSQSSLAFLQNTGYGLLGLGIFLQGLAVKKKREEA